MLCQKSCRGRAVWRADGQSVLSEVAATWQEHFTLFWGSVAMKVESASNLASATLSHCPRSFKKKDVTACRVLSCPQVDSSARKLINRAVSKELGRSSSRMPLFPKSSACQVSHHFGTSISACLLAVSPFYQTLASGCWHCRSIYSAIHCHASMVLGALISHRLFGEAEET